MHSAYAYNHNWDFFEHSFAFFPVPIFCATETNLHGYTFICASYSQSVFFPQHLHQLFNEVCLFIFWMPRDYVSLDGYTERAEKKLWKKFSGMSNVNKARAFSAFTVYFRCDNGNSCRSTRLHYNLLPRNYKLFVVSDISQFQHTHTRVYIENDQIGCIAFRCNHFEMIFLLVFLFKCCCSSLWCSWLVANAQNLKLFQLLKSTIAVGHIRHANDWFQTKETRRLREKR